MSLHTDLPIYRTGVDLVKLAKITRHKDIRILQNTYYRETAEQISARL